MEELNIITEMRKPASNIRSVRKHFEVNIQLKGEMYDIQFRYNTTKKTTEQMSLLKYYFINDEWGYTRKLMPGYLAYIHLQSGIMEMKLSQSDNPATYAGYALVDYEMFDGATWTGFFKYPPR
jgi:hypothetical protein